MNTQIKEIFGYEILDSRGNPTVCAKVTLEDGTVAEASSPSGASTGSREAIEKRDGDPLRFGGKGVLKAVDSVNKVIAPALSGFDCTDIQKCDRTIIALDGTDNKSNLGANATLAVSLACARAAAASLKMPLYRFLGGKVAHKLPIPMMNILNGGAHAQNNIDIQEFMIVPLGAQTFGEAMQIGAEVYHSLKKILASKGLSTGVGDEGGFAPNLSSDTEALDLIVEAIEKSGHNTDKVALALDIASSEWQTEKGIYRLPKRGVQYNSDELIEYVKNLCQKYPIVSVEDGLGESDFNGWTKMTESIGDEVLLVGDDLFVTNSLYLRRGFAENMANSILIKPNQIGTLSETLETVDLARENGYRHILSHRSGETCDTSIADIAVATAADYIKTGAPCRGERIAKYNRLLAIEHELGAAARFGILEV